MDDLLDAVRLQHGKLRLAIKTVSLKEIVADAVVSVRHGVVQRGQQLTGIGLDNDITLHGDYVRLSQVVANLLSNSIRYTPERGHIWVTCEADERMVTISVKDDGNGIAPEDLPSVCKLFVQCRQGPQGFSGGLGVGLAVVRRIVELHHGTFEVASPGTGKGTTVTVRLPRWHDSETSNDGAGQTDARANATPRRVLLVDDCEDALKSLSMVLELEGHSVETADSGTGALRRLATSKPDVAIVDIGLPDMDGFDIAGAIRRDESCNGIHLIALSGYADEAYRDRAIAAGFNAYVVKPLSINQLRAILAGCNSVFGGADFMN
jgi:CheY-like chemotaxis protein/anti-sigma regulatory factor (Ser/Thr protein kinase)